MHPGKPSTALSLPQHSSCPGTNWTKTDSLPRPIPGTFLSVPTPTDVFCNVASTSGAFHSALRPSWHAGCGHHVAAKPSLTLISSTKQTVWLCWMRSADDKQADDGWVDVTGTGSVLTGGSRWTQKERERERERRYKRDVDVWSDPNHPSILVYRSDSLYTTNPLL